MHPFSYVRADEEDTAIAAAVQNQGAAYVAGGTNLIDLMKLDVEQPIQLVDINDLPLSQVNPLGEGVRIGAMVRNSDLAYHPLIRARYPALSEALLSGASPQLRNMATVGGNLMQRTRCYYFRDVTTPCNKRTPGSGCSAIDGFNRIHAILGTSEHCIATHPSDMCVALAALEATIRTRGPGGERAIPVDQFYLLPDNHPERETVLEPGELIVAVDLPPMPFAHNSRYLKVRDRASYAFALASAAVALDVRNGVIRQARIALGGVGARPWRSRPAEQVLEGRAPGKAAYQDAASAALHGAHPYRYNAFKVELARRTLVRALTEVGGSA